MTSDSGHSDEFKSRIKVNHKKAEWIIWQPVNEHTPSSSENDQTEDHSVSGFRRLFALYFNSPRECLPVVLLVSPLNFSLI